MAAKHVMVSVMVSSILVPRSRAPFGQHQESRPLTSGRPSGQIRPDPTPEVRYSRTSVTLRMLRVKSHKSDWSQSHSIVFAKPIRTGISLDLSRGRDILVLTKRSAAFRDEKRFPRVSRIAHARYGFQMIDRFLYWGDRRNQKSGEIKDSCGKSFCN